ncbi:Short-chain dehydrogenase/reductase prx1 [Cladobotryum mycophilum]|uniref:Short-chain dehydrogenase/reductase prx1 n=1 Tax=Cladobotryum mycophilum TaxID=491253 RepID=A0ABR0SW56_9HYPO
MTNPLNPYIDLYAKPLGVGDQRPTGFQVVQDNNAIAAYSGKVVLITGGTNGIGLETVRAMHATGADVFFTARDVAKGERVRQDILSKSEGKGKLEVIIMDMDSLESVRGAANDFLAKSSKLNVLINNAGIMNTPYSKTTDGFERQFGVNHLAHFLLTVLLLPALEAAASLDFASRVINVSSSSHRYSQVDFDNYNYTPETYNGSLAYGQSKTANIWMANYIDRVYGPRGVHGLSLGPGGIWTGLLAFTNTETVANFKKDPKVVPNMQSAEQGCATILWAAVGKKTGDFFTAMSSAAASWVKGQVAEEDRLWELSAKLTGVKA